MNRLSLPSTAKASNLGWLETQVYWNKPWPKMNRSSQSHRNGSPGLISELKEGIIQSCGWVWAEIWVFYFSHLVLPQLFRFAVTLCQCERSTFYAVSSPWLSLCTPGDAEPQPQSRVGALPALGMKGFGRNQGTPCHAAGQDWCFLEGKAISQQNWSSCVTPEVLPCNLL